MKIRTIVDPDNDMYLRATDLLLFLYATKENPGDHTSTDFIIKQVKKLKEEAEK